MHTLPMTIESTDVPAEPLSFERFAALAHWRIELELTRAGLTPGASLRDDARQEALLALWRVYRVAGASGAPRVPGRLLHGAIRRGIAGVFRLYSHLPRTQYDNLRELRALERSMTREEALDELRRQGWREERISRMLAAEEFQLLSLDAPLPSGETADYPDENPGPRAQLEAKEREQAIDRSLAALPAKLRAVVAHKLHGGTFSELAPGLNLSKQGVHMRFLRGLRRFRASLSSNLKD